jgi:SH3 domain-containing YSC84-like protein 1
MRLATCFVAITLLPAFAAVSSEERAKVVGRINDASLVLDEIMTTSDRGIPADLLKKAECAVVIPAMKKGAFIVGARYGKGFVSCRTGARRGWSAPGAVRVEGGSVGFQIGGQEADVIMLIMNRGGMEKLLSTKFTLGGDVSVAAGPVGRSSQAMTDAAMKAEILTWSRSRGAFAGIALTGGTLREDSDDNEALYGKAITNKQLVNQAAAPAQARKLPATLAKWSPAEGRVRTAKAVRKKS